MSDLHDTIFPPSAVNVAGSFDHDPASTTLPMVGAIPPLDSRDRSDGGHLDRTAWVYEFSRRHNLTKPERAVLHYMAFRAAPQRLFQCDDAEDQIGEWTGYERHSINRAIKGLVRKGALMQTRPGGKGIDHQPARYRLRGVETDWRVQGVDGKADGTGSSIGQETEASMELRVPSEQASMEPGVLPMEPGVLPDGTRSSTPPGLPPGLPPVVSPDKSAETTDTTTRKETSAQAASSLSLADPYSEPENLNLCGCGEARFENFRECLPCLVDRFQLADTWEKGRSAAVRWYRQHPDEFIEQIREAAADMGAKISSPGSEGEVISDVPSSMQPPPDQGGGTFRCDRCGENASFDVAFDGVLHRDYSFRDETGAIERARCGGYWQKISEEGDDV